jgi:hypothetical protein
MSKSRLFQVVVLIAIVAFFACSQLAIAQAKPQIHRMMVGSAHPQFHPNAGTTEAPPAAALDPIAATMTNWVGYDTVNSIDWAPCAWWWGTAYAADCPENANPNANNTFAYNWPVYTFPLANNTTDVIPYGCDGTTNGSTPSAYLPCGQIMNFWEDNTLDATDDELYILEVTQGANVIYHSGTQDWGPTGLTSWPADYTDWADVNFGTLGITTGKNNGNCAGNSGYPATASGAIGFTIASGKTCVDPKNGVATVSITLELATPTWACKGTVCTVKYAKKYSLAQKFNIYLYDVPTS